MPRRKIREFQAKKLLDNHIKRFSPVSVNLRCVQATKDTDFRKLVEENGWLSHERLVVKPDMLFGKRGKNNLVLLNASFADAENFIKERIGKTVTVGGLSGEVTHFIIEPFVPHQDEYYLSIMCTRETNTIAFSECGGIEIEENWDKVRKLEVTVNDPIEHADLGMLFDPSPASPLNTDPARRNAIQSFIMACYRLFEDMNYHFLEMNPFTLVPAVLSPSSWQPIPLDMRAELDDCAHFRNSSKWVVNGKPVEFPSPFGRSFTQEEQSVRSMDEQTGASLKLTVLNPNGRIWCMIAGGGASVIYADTVADLGYGDELGNYGEYSGDPSEDETYAYASTLLSLATSQCTDNRPRALLIGGAIANFTDVAATFSGIIRALREHAAALAKANVKVFVRRGGPNYQIGLQKMRDLGKQLSLPFDVYGPETHMTKIVKQAIEWVNQSPMANGHCKANGVHNGLSLPNGHDHGVSNGHVNGIVINGVH